MERNTTFEVSATYSEGVRKALRSAIDFLSVIAALVVALNVTRAVQFGATFFTTTSILLVFCVLPSIFLRGDRYLALRGGLVVSGYMVANLIGITDLGLGAAAFVAFPFHLALCAALFSRGVTYLYIASMAGAVVVMAYLFTNGVLVAPDVSLAIWSASAANWTIMFVTLLVTLLLVSSLVYNLSRFWKETDSDAAKQTKQFETLVEYAPDAILMLDVANDEVLSVNTRAEALFGASRNKLVGGPKLHEYSPELQPTGESSIEAGRKRIREALAGGHPTYEWIHLNEDGQEVPCEVSLTRMPPFDRKIIRANVADISRRKAEQAQRDELQSQLAAAQRLESIGHLTGGVAHDFNNLLAVILSNLEILEEDCESEDRKRRLQACIDASLRGADLTRNMLSYARRAPLQPKIVDINHLVRETHNWVGRTLPSSIEIDVSLLAGIWSIETDPSATESAIVNLLLNARDAMPSGGKLTIETANIRIDHAYVDDRSEVLDVGRYVMVAVSDTGTGIPKDKLEDIFTPFFTTKASGKGSGLGLPMVMGFMRQSGGTSQVYSEEGVGSTFKLYFPAVETPKHTGLKIKTDNTTAPTGKNRILLAEDEPEVRDVLRTILAAAGYSVVTAVSGDDAKQIFEADQSFDLLLTDIVMPGELQGTTLSKELRLIDETLPVVFMSGYASEATVHGNGLRPDDVRLMKPVMKKDLLDAISGALKVGTRSS